MQTRDEIKDKHPQNLDSMEKGNIIPFSVYIYVTIIYYNIFSKQGPDNEYFC